MAKLSVESDLVVLTELVGEASCSTAPSGEGKVESADVTILRVRIVGRSALGQHLRDKGSTSRI